MDRKDGMVIMALGSWLVALLGGTLAGTLLWVLGGWGFLQGAFVGLLVFIILGAVISWIMMRPLPAPNEAVLVTPPAPGSKRAAQPAVKPAAAPAAAAPPKAAKPAAKKAAPKKAAQPKAKAAETSDARPTLMKDAPDGGQADDLKKISGVGPKLEQTLNDLGIWHYEQVASLTKTDIAWVDERLRFKGRIERDDWIGQAKALAKGKG